MKQKRHDWTEIKNDYVINELSQPEICKKYGVSVSQLGLRAKKENWLQERKEKKRQIEENVKKKAIKNEVDRRVAINEEHIELFNQGLDLVRSILEEYKDFQAQKKEGGVNPVLLEKLFNCIEKGQKGQRLAIGADKEENIDDKPPEVKYIIGLDIDKI